MIFFFWKKLRLNEIFEQIKKQKLPENIKSFILGVACVDSNENDTDIPLVKYYFWI